ncbi:MAG: hypothetical protein J6B96_02250 [Agathobacter sp.]|nr:hypothetical protein [Agathobacter sp.]
MRDYRLTEEIARWAFEIQCKQTPNWYIAFTNPTAGPWKAITALNKNSEVGRIYTFDAKEKRPDIILINDHLKIIIIVEAKNSLSALNTSEQCSKSTKVVADIGKQLQKLRTDEYWGKRYMYNIVLGLLWGSEEKMSLDSYIPMFDLYYNEICNYDNIDKRALIGIEVTRSNSSLSCMITGKNYEQGTQTLSLSNLANSFNLSYKE